MRIRDLLRIREPQMNLIVIQNSRTLKNFEIDFTLGRDFEPQVDLRPAVFRGSLERLELGPADDEERFRLSPQRFCEHRFRRTDPAKDLVVAAVLDAGGYVRRCGDDLVLRRANIQTLANARFGRAIVWSKQ